MSVTYSLYPSEFISDQGRIRMRFTVDVDRTVFKPAPCVTVDIDLSTASGEQSPPDPITVQVTPQKGADLDFSSDSDKLIGELSMWSSPQGGWALLGEFTYREEFHFIGSMTLIHKRIEDVRAS